MMFFIRYDEESGFAMKPDADPNVFVAWDGTVYEFAEASLDPWMGKVGVDAKPQEDCRVMDRHECPRCTQRSTVVQTFSNSASRVERHCCPHGHVWTFSWTRDRSVSGENLFVRAEPFAVPD